MKEVLGWLVIYVGVMWFIAPAALGGIDDIAGDYIHNVIDAHFVALIILCILAVVFMLGLLLHWSFT